MPVTVKVGDTTVVIFKKSEVKKAEGFEVFSVTIWLENSLEQRAELTTAQMRELITILGQLQKPGQPVGVNCEGGVHRSVVAAILYLWSRSDRTLAQIFETVDEAFANEGKRPSKMVKNTLGFAVWKLLGHHPGTNEQNWQAVKDLVHAGPVQQRLTGA